MEFVSEVYLDLYFRYLWFVLCLFGRSSFVESHARGPLTSRPYCFVYDLFFVIITLKFWLYIDFLVLFHLWFLIFVY